MLYHKIGQVIPHYHKCPDCGNERKCYRVTGCLKPLIVTCYSCYYKAFDRLKEKKDSDTRLR